MPSRPVRIPKYRRHKSGQAFVQVKGERFYIGKHGTEESIERYNRFVAELTASPTPESVTPNDWAVQGALVIELCAAYLRWALEYYGEDSGSIDRVKVALRVLKETHGHVPVAEFGPLSLQAIQRRLADGNNSRRYVNHLTSAICRVFKWGVTQEIVPEHIHRALATVPGLRRGKSKAREAPPVLPIPEANVQAALPYLSPIVADMVRFQRLTGCRPGEVAVIRPADINRTDNIWEYRPSSHKGEWRGKERVIFIGPKAQAILLPYLLRDADAFCFSPVESEKKRRAKLAAARKTPMSCGNRAGTNRKAHPKRTPRERYDANSYRRAIHRACELAGIDHWSPNRLRHSAATEIRRLFGLEAAQVTLGHASADITQVYAERDSELARSVALKIG